MPLTLNHLITQEQERLRDVVSTLWREEYPLDPKDLKYLSPFVRRVRSEVKEDTTPGQGSIRRVDYWVLNDLGRDLYRKWQLGKLDQLVGRA